MKLIQTLIFSVACVVSFSATAQWQWVDKDGRKVFSDTPPPSDIPESKILRRPRGKPGAVPSAAPVEASDIRAGAALVLAGLVAEGETVVAGVQHIDRGYADMDAVLRALGADVTRVTLAEYAYP